MQWIQERQVATGVICTAQGLLKHVADVGAAIWTIILAVHVFCVLFLDMRAGRRVLLITLLSGWLSIFFIVAPGGLVIEKKGRGPFYGIDGHWCWISAEYGLSQKLLAQMAMFLAAPVSAVLCTLVFLRLRGNVLRDGWNMTFRRVAETPDKCPDKDDTTAVRHMLLYPVTYAVLIAPMAVVEFVRWSGVYVPFAWIVFSQSAYLLSGVASVIVFAVARRLLPTSSLRIGSWHLFPLTSAQDQFVAQAIYAEDLAEKGRAKTVTFAAEPTILCTPPGRRNTRRPPPLVVASYRYSLDSMYSAREGCHNAPAPLSSHWRADTPPLPVVLRPETFRRQK